MSALEDNWDSYGSLPITTPAILMVKQIIADIEDDCGFCVAFGPLPTGGIDIEIDEDDGNNNLLIEVFPEGEHANWALYSEANNLEMQSTCGTYTGNVQELIYRMEEEHYGFYGT